MASYGKQPRPERPLRSQGRWMHPDPLPNSLRSVVRIVPAAGHQVGKAHQRGVVRGNELHQRRRIAALDTRQEERASVRHINDLRAMNAKQMHHPGSPLRG